MLIAPDLTWLDGRLAKGFALRLDAGRIAELRPLGADTPDFRPHLVMPGATDLQVNGAGGVLLNDDPAPAAMRAIRDAMRARGTADILPTLITDAPGKLAQAADAAIAVAGEEGLAGLHLEGPHIHPDRAGTHDPRHIRPLNGETLAALERLRAAGAPVLLTLAPELAEPAMLRRLAAMGVVLSAGHSMASAAQARAAMAAGVTMATHLFNAMPPLHHRAPGLAVAALLSEAWIGLIADGLHVDWDMIRLALAARPRPDRCFLVSDAMPSIGGPERFLLYGRPVRVEGGRLLNEDGGLAGAHLDMITALRRLHRDGGVDLARCVAMATDLPRAAMGLAPLTIRPGQPAARIATLDADLRFAGWLGAA